METMRVSIDPDLCTGCGLCEKACGRKLIVMDQGTVSVSDPLRCSQCGHCKCVCPVDAPQLPCFDPGDFPEAPYRDNLPSPQHLLTFLQEHIVPISFMLGYPAIHYERLPARNPARITWL